MVAGCIYSQHSF